MYGHPYVGEALTCAGFEELNRASGCILDSGDVPKRDADDCESGEAFILSLRRDDGTCASVAAARGRFLGGCNRLGFMVPSDESCIRQSTASSASSSMSIDCTCWSAAAAAARLGEPGEPGWSVSAPSFASEIETGIWQTGSWLQSAFAADKLSWERTTGGVISSGPSTRTNPVCMSMVCQVGAARFRARGVDQILQALCTQALRLRLCRSRRPTAGSASG